MNVHDRCQLLVASALDFDLEPAERDLIERHLAVCPTCPTVAVALAADAATIAALPRPVRTAPAALRPRPGPLRLAQPSFRLVAIAALLALLALGALAAGGELIRRLEESTRLALNPSPAVPSLIAGPGSPAPTGPSPSAGPSGGPSAAASAISPPTASPAPSSGSTIVAGAVVRTSAAGFEVRPRTQRSAAPIDLGGPMAAGTLLFVAAGPVAAGGSDWYFVMPYDIGPAGWATIADPAGKPLVKPATDRCPESPLEPQELLSLGSFGGLACFGGSEIRIVGDLACAAADVDRPFSGPDWMAVDHRCSIDLGGQTFEIHDRGMATLPSTVRGATVIGHFDDAQAATCVWSLDPPAPDAIAVATNCRAMFVATTIIVGP